MITNCRVELTDEQRNILYRRLTGKDVKGLISRAGVVKLINDHIDSLLHDVVEQSHDEPEQVDFCSTDCCKANKLLRSRINTIQHRLDKITQG